MDVYFCDECGTRVTSLDLRGGKGMRRRHDVICSGCVDLGKANEWLARSGANSATEPVPALKAPAPPSVTTPIPAKPDLIAEARDRARTQRDLPPQPVPQVVEPSPKVRLPETDVIPACQPTPKPASEGFAAVAGGFASLGPAADAKPMDADPEDAADDLVPRSAAEAASPFQSADKQAKLETRTPVPKSGRSTTSRQRAAQKTTNRKPVVVEKSNKRMLIGTLVSLAIVTTVFVLLMLNSGGEKKPQKVIKDNPLEQFEAVLVETKKICHDAINADDLAKLETAKGQQQKLNEAMDEFNRRAQAMGWSEDHVGQQLENLHYQDVKALIRRINDRIMVLKSQQKGH